MLLLLKWAHFWSILTEVSERPEMGPVGLAAQDAVKQLLEANCSVFKLRVW